MMQGRTEDKIIAERKMQSKVSALPKFMIDYYYYLNEKTYMTKEEYLNIVIRFLNYFSNNNINSLTETDLSVIDATTIQKYIMDIQFIDNRTEIKNSSKAIIYSSLNSFLTFLKKKHILAENPFDNNEIERPKTTDNDIIYLEPEEYSIVKNNIMNGVGTDRAKAKQKKWMYRDLLLFQLPIITGVRVTALSQISFDDIDFNKKTIKVIDKAREKVMYLDDETLGLIYIWKENREELMKGYESCPYLFISNQRKKMDVVSIRRVVSKYTSCLDKHISPHKLRHTCGTNLYAATKDIYLVSQVLGHKSPATSRKYTQVSTSQRENAAQLLSNRMKMSITN